ncbi:hypothetical protein [Streptomyces sp. CA2R101]|uniref:hypothetical protein n=1 Tax=Streptomyces sp. CA2R101 TaxID=3120152 RepID=UPI00300BF226
MDSSTGPLAGSVQQPQGCIGGRVFADSALSTDADLMVDGLLVDFKSTRHPHLFRSPAAVYGSSGR